MDMSRLAPLIHDVLFARRSTSPPKDTDVTLTSTIPEAPPLDAHQASVTARAVAKLPKQAQTIDPMSHPHEHSSSTSSGGASKHDKFRHALKAAWRAPAPDAPIQVTKHQFSLDRHPDTKSRRYREKARGLARKGGVHTGHVATWGSPLDGIRKVSDHNVEEAMLIADEDIGEPHEIPEASSHLQSDRSGAELPTERGSSSSSSAASFDRADGEPGAISDANDWPTPSEAKEKKLHELYDNEDEYDDDEWEGDVEGEPALLDQVRAATTSSSMSSSSSSSSKSGMSKNMPIKESSAPAPAMHPAQPTGHNLSMDKGIMGGMAAAMKDAAAAMPTPTQGQASMAH